MEDFGGLAIGEDYDNGKTVLICCYIFYNTDNFIPVLLGLEVSESLCFLLQ